MIQPHNPNEITEKEQQFLDGLMKLFAPEGGELVGIHKKVYDVTKKILEEKGEGTLEDIMKAGQIAFNEMYEEQARKTDREVRSTSHALFTQETPEHQKAFDEATKAQTRLVSLIERDKQDMMPQQTLALAKQIGLKSGITKAEQKFLEGMNKLINEEGGPSGFQEELYNTLKDIVSQAGESTREELIAVIEKVKSKDIETNKLLKEKYENIHVRSDYDEEIQMPKIQKIIDKSGLKNGGRE